MVNAPALPGSGCCGCKPPIETPLPLPNEIEVERLKYHKKRRHDAFVQSNVPIQIV